MNYKIFITISNTLQQVFDVLIPMKLHQANIIETVTKLLT